jgi:hypothetical protein
LRWCTHCLECLGHNLGAVVDSEDNICDAGRSKRLDLMLDHGLVCELDQRLRQCECLQPELVAHHNGEHRGGVDAAVSEGQSYKRAQAGSKPSDENDGCSAC